MEVDFLTLADAAQVVGDKLYMLGGGWNFVRAPQFPLQHQMAIAVGFSVEWLETNRRHDFRIEMRNEDGGQKVADLAGQFEAGRPAGIPPGAEQKVLLASSFVVQLERPGQYVVRLFLNGHEVKRQSFMAISTQVTSTVPPPEAPER